MKIVGLFALILLTGFANAQGSLEKRLHIHKQYHPCTDIKREQQSPVNIIRANDKAKHDLKFQYKASHAVVINKGHTVEVDYDTTNALFFDAKRYHLLQFHFHTPSEHHIHGEKFPLELHFVHRSKDSSYLVLSVHFRQGKENPFLDEFLKDIPTEEHKEHFEEFVDINKAFPNKKKAFYYQGSFTTPPFSEGVRWVVFEQAQPISVRQIKAVKAIEGNNARKIQELNEKQIDKF